MMMTTQEGMRKRIELEYSINELGNWNYKFPDESKVSGKPIVNIILGENKFVWKHDEIMKLIEAYHVADIIAVGKIINPDVDTGMITIPEKLFLDKLKEKIKELEK